MCRWRAWTTASTPTAPDWSRSGVITFNNATPSNATDLWMLPMSGGRTPAVFLSSKHTEANGALSPDGRWIAYNSNVSGREEIYVRPFPDKNPVHPVSRDGGRFPRWRADGKELFFLTPEGMMMAAAV